MGERLQHEGDFSHEDITGQDEPPVDSPPTQGENTATGLPGPDGEGQMDVDPEARRRMRGKTRPSAGSPVDATPKEEITTREDMRDLGERQQHEGDFPEENITEQDEPQVDSSFTSRKNKATGSSSKEQMDVEPEARGRMRGKTRPISPEQSTSALVNANFDAAPQEERDHDDKRRRVVEPVSPVSTVAPRTPTFSPVLFDSETRDDEIAVHDPLPEEPTETSGENGQDWITEEAFFTVSPGARQVRQRKKVKMNQLTPAERREFVKSMDIEWQTLLMNQAANLLSLEEMAQARERWPDRALGTRWARIWRLDDSMPSGRRAKARLIIKGVTDPDLLDIESHSPTLTREGFVTVLRSVCSHGHKLQFGHVQQAFNTGNSIKREQPFSSECQTMESRVSSMMFVRAVAQDS